MSSLRGAKRRSNLRKIAASACSLLAMTTLRAVNAILPPLPNKIWPPIRGPFSFPTSSLRDRYAGADLDARSAPEGPATGCCRSTGATKQSLEDRRVGLQPPRDDGSEGCERNPAPATHTIDGPPCEGRSLFRVCRSARETWNSRHRLCYCLPAQVLPAVERHP